MTFEVDLKSRRLFAGGKSDDNTEAPGSEFSGVGNVPCVMAAQTLLGIIGESRVVTGWVRNRFEYISVVHGLPGRSSERRAARLRLWLRRGRLRSSRRSERSLVPRGRFELPTYGLGNRCSVQLSYRGPSAIKPVNIDYDQ